jgi:outer membrane protein assembly factor BamA
MTGGVDVLLRHAWLLQGWWSADGQEPGYALSYRGGWSWPALDLSSSLILDESPGFPLRLQRVWTYASVGATFTFTRLARSLALRAGWSGTGYDSVEAERVLPSALEPFRFRDGLLSEASLQARYSDARRFTRSISPEQGRTVTLSFQLAAPEIGSDYALARARAAVTQYVRIPYTRHVVLALRVAGGAADGTIGGRAPFKLGGYEDPDVLAFLPGTISSPSDQLRGYPRSALQGTAYLLGNVELRFPLAAPTRGRSTWPLFLRRVHGALFVDAGDAFDLPGELAIAGHELDAEQIRFGAGAELRLEVVLGYHLRTDVRVGVARGLGALLGEGRAADRRVDLDPAVVYVTIGPSF